MDIGMNRVKIREVTALDKQNVLSMRDSVDVILDTLPALYDYYSSIPNAYIAGVFYDENLAGALVGHIVDGGKTCVLRSRRAAPQYEGRGLTKLLVHHVGQWAVDSGVQSILSFAGEYSANWSEKSGFSVKIIYTCRWTEVTFTPDRQIREGPDETGNLENISDVALRRIFNDKLTRDYIAPKGVILIHWTPLKPLVENIPTIRGVEGSTHIYSDIKPGPDGCTGLLTCCTKYKAAARSQTDFKFCLDVSGSDLSSLRKHIVKHLNNIRKESDIAVALEMYLPVGFEWDDVIPIFNEFGINFGEGVTYKKPCALEWLPKTNASG